MVTNHAAGARQIAVLAAEASAALERWRARSKKPGPSSLDILRVEFAVELASAAASGQAFVTRPLVCQLVCDDLRCIASLLDTGSTESMATASIVSGRLIDALASLPAVEEPDGMDRQRAKEALPGLAAAYGEDARSDRRHAWIFYCVAALAASVGVFVALGGIFEARSPARFRTDEFVAFATVAAAIVLIALAASLHASGYRRAASEAVRIQRQLLGVDAYTSDMPVALRELMRATMLHQLFPRILDDNEPWRDPQWPTPENILKVMFKKPRGSASG